MTIYPFSGGGYVAHGIRVAGSPLRLSAWYTHAGDLIDAEVRDRMRRVRRVKAGGPVWRGLQRIGRNRIAA